MLYNFFLASRAPTQFVVRVPKLPGSPVIQATPQVERVSSLSSDDKHSSESKLSSNVLSSAFGTVR